MTAGDPFHRRLRRALALVAAAALALALLPLTGAEAQDQPGYVSEIASGPLAGTSFVYMRSENTPRIEDVGPIEGPVTYVGLACDDSPAVPEAPDDADIALMERGECLFVDKMDNVVEAGYSAVLMFNEDTGDDDACDTFPSSMSTSAPIPMLAIWRTTGLQLLGEAGADPVPCPGGPEIEAAIGTVGESVLISAEFDPESTETGFEQRGSTDWTTHDEELAFLDHLDDTSELMEYEVIGQSVYDRPLHLVRVGAPEPPSMDEIADGPSVLLICSQHGDEPAGREMCLQLMRDLALSEDPATLEYLSETTVLFVPSANPDGRVADTRGNAWGTDINRDHLHLVTPEGQALARVVRDARPDVVLDAHERGGSTPDLEVLWSRNLNVDEQVQATARDLVQETLRPGLEDRGFTTGIYGEGPGGAGGGDERIARNMFGLRYSLGVLAESPTGQAPVDRVAVHMAGALEILDYHDANADDIAMLLDEARDRQTAQGAAQSEPYYFAGADDNPPDPEDVVDPPPCGYALNSQQAANMAMTFDRFGIEAEAAGDNVFVPMAQPLQTVVPLLLDARATYNVVDGLALQDCSDPASAPVPEPEPAAQHFTGFFHTPVGERPDDWSVQWRDSDWTVLDDPRRLRHVVDSAGGRRALTWDDPGTVEGDVEVSTMVRGQTSGRLFQLPIAVSGDAGDENAYYLDANPDDDDFRINRYEDGSYSGLASLDVELDEDTWYRVVFRREANRLMGKIWADGDEEPEGWQIVVTDDDLAGGAVGFSQFTAGSTTDHAFLGVGTGGQPAPRTAPCPDPDDRDTVVIGGIDTGVPNRVDPLGCTINDLVDDDTEWASTGHFVRHVNAVVRDLLDQDLLDGHERAALTRAAARSGIGRPGQGGPG